MLASFPSSCSSAHAHAQETGNAAGDMVFARAREKMRGPTGSKSKQSCVFSRFRI